MSPFWPFWMVWCWKSTGWGCCFRGWVLCLATLSNPCLFPALEQGSRRKAKGNMWQVCSKDVEMNHFNQLTFQPGNQTCLWLRVPCGTHFSPQESSLSPFLCSSECDLHLGANRFRTQGLSDLIFWLHWWSGADGGWQERPEYLGFFLVCDSFVFAGKINGTQGCWLTRWYSHQFSLAGLVWHSWNGVHHITDKYGNYL